MKFPQFLAWRTVNPFGHARVLAFSLVEVTMSLGLVAFALLPVMGLMPVGFNVMRDAIDSTVHARITQQIHSEALLTPFSKLTDSFADTTFYYNEEGRLLGKTPASAPSDTRYWATTTINAPIFPGSENVLSKDTLTNNIQSISLHLVTAASVNAKSNASTLCVIDIPNSGN
ncbi:MAG: Verru_Chthon cassette protein B [Chthoniobacteraceae bacterium]